MTQIQSEQFEISVVIPTYNRAKTIRTSVMSVLSQSAPILEVVVVDDCSSDDTLLQLAAIEDSRVRIVRSSSQSGAAAARNLGVKHARGSWIAFQDSDDYWFASKLEKQIEAIKQHPQTVLCYCWFIQYYNQNVVLVPKVTNEIRNTLPTKSLLQSNFVSAQTILMRRSIFEILEGFDERLPALEDWEFALRASKLGEFCSANEPLVIAYETPGSLTSNISKGNEARLKIIEAHTTGLADRQRILSHHFHVVGKLYLHSKKLKLARQNFWASVRHNPNRPTTWFWLLVTSLKAPFLGAEK